MKKFDSFLISDVSSSSRLSTSSSSSLSIHHQESSAVSLPLSLCNCKELNVDLFSPHHQESSADSFSPSQCDHKEMNVDFFPSPHQELSVSSDTDFTNPYPPNSLREKVEGLRWVAFNSLQLKQFENGVEYIESDLQGE